MEVQGPGALKVITWPPQDLGTLLSYLYSPLLPT